jgi:hypothetical protein
VNEVAEIEWAAALHSPRHDLCQRYANDPPNHRQWALPLLYVRPDPFTVKHVAASPDPEELARMRRKAEMVAGQLRTLPPDAPAEMRDALLGILAGLPPELVPDRNGEFPSGELDVDEPEPAG